MMIMFKTLARDTVTLGRLYVDHGNMYVTVRHDGEHHSTIRREAVTIVKRYNDENGTNYAVNAYVGLVHFRDTSGMPVTDKRFTVVDLG